MARAEECTISVEQGVSKGGVLSTHPYTGYINELLLDLERHIIGISIGSTYTGCSTCTYDSIRLTSNQIELQDMLH